MTIVARTLVLTCCLVLPLGCSALGNSDSVDRLPSLIELGYVEGGDAPAVTLIKVLPSRKMTFQQVGRRPFDKRLAKSEFENLRGVLEAPSFVDALLAEAKRGSAVADHGEFIGIEAGGILVQRSYALLPESVKEVIRAIDASARRHFPKKSEDFLFPIPD